MARYANARGTVPFGLSGPEDREDASMNRARDAGGGGAGSRASNSAEQTPSVAVKRFVIDDGHRSPLEMIAGIYTGSE